MLVSRSVRRATHRQTRAMWSGGEEGLTSRPKMAFFQIFSLPLRCGSSALTSHFALLAARPLTTITTPRRHHEEHSSSTSQTQAGARVGSSVASPAACRVSHQSRVGKLTGSSHQANHGQCSGRARVEARRAPGTRQQRALLRTHQQQGALLEGRLYSPQSQIVHFCQS